MIENKNMIYSPTYDVYVDSTTNVIYKRQHRLRKSEITDAELIPCKIVVKSYSKYPKIYDRHGRSVGIYYIYADVWPEKVHCWENHLADPETFRELDHINSKHETIEDNLPHNLRWTTPKLNRARTTRTVNVYDESVDEKRRNTLLRRRQRYQERKIEDPEWMERKRKRDAERKLKMYYDSKDARKELENRLNSEWAELSVAEQSK